MKKLRFWVAITLAGLMSICVIYGIVRNQSTRAFERGLFQAQKDAPSAITWSSINRTFKTVIVDNCILSNGNQQVHIKKLVFFPGIRTLAVVGHGIQIFQPGPVSILGAELLEAKISHLKYNELTAANTTSTAGWLKLLDTAQVSLDAIRVPNTQTQPENLPNATELDQPKKDRARLDHFESRIKDEHLWNMRLKNFDSQGEVMPATPLMPAHIATIHLSTVEANGLDLQTFSLANWTHGFGLERLRVTNFKNEAIEAALIDYSATIKQGVPDSINLLVKNAILPQGVTPAGILALGYNGLEISNINLIAHRPFSTPSDFSFETSIKEWGTLNLFTLTTDHGSVSTNSKNYSTNRTLTANLAFLDNGFRRHVIQASHLTQEDVASRAHDFIVSQTRYLNDNAHLADQIRDFALGKQNTISFTAFLPHFPSILDAKLSP